MDFENPFEITKAADFSDEEIMNYWVDIRLGTVVNPKSPMPKYILGGKGSGKTHLMRHYSYQLQKLRSSAQCMSAAQGIHTDGYVGIYMRCSGLNSERFNKKGLSLEQWNEIFATYMDLWLAKHVLSVIQDAFASTPDLFTQEQNICADILALLEIERGTKPHTLESVIAVIRKLLRGFDIAINKLPLTQQWDIQVHITPGQLVFGVPKILAKHITALRGVQFTYLIDEAENLREEQQKYIGTLVREKEPPCTFRIGARTYGIRTHETFSAGEVNRAGAEFELLVMDSQLRREKKKYSEFAQKLVDNRLRNAGYVPLNESEVTFEIRDDEAIVTEKLQQHPGRERVCLKNLADKLQAGIRAGNAPGVASLTDIESIVTRLQFPERPLLEQTNVFLLYRAWSRKHRLPEAANKISLDCARYVEDPSDPTTDHKKVLNKFKGDLLARLSRDYDIKQRYLGVPSFIEMSQGLPRPLLITLKNIFKWSVFKGEKPFQRGQTISIQAQQQGVLDSADWFFTEVRNTDPHEVLVREGITRLAELFRAIRFSDKPSECSLCTFSVNEWEISPQAREIIHIAEKWSFLIRIREGQKDRNSKRVDAKYQLNSILSPLWDLPIARRGTIALGPNEANSIFDPNFSSEFADYRKKRLARMNAPFLGSDSKSSKVYQTRLLGIEQ